MNAHVPASQLTASERYDDPLKEIIAELAQIERRLTHLRKEDVKEALDNATEGLSEDEFSRKLYEQREALMALASHRQAQSSDGILLQALIALDVDLLAVTAELPMDFRASREGRDCRAAEARVRRLLYSIVYADDDIGEDLRLLRDCMAPLDYHEIAQAEQLPGERNAISRAS